MRASLIAWVLLCSSASAAFLACSSSATINESTGGDPGDDGGVIVILDGGGGVAKPPDGAALCPKGACNYQTSAGCSGATACSPEVDGNSVAPACVGAGSGTSGDSCDPSHPCAAKYACIGSTCAELCCGGDWAACDSSNEHCFTALQFQTSSGVVPTGAMICQPINTCDALDPASCPTSGTTCQIVDPTGATACVPEGAGDVGGPCPCQGGSLCVANTCRQLCKAVEGGGEPFCGAGEGICVHFDRDPSGVGECTP